MKTQTTKLLTSLGALFILPLLLFSCGQPGTGTGDGGGSDGSGVSIKGSVEAPVTTSASVSVGVSASKDVKTFVSKATSDAPVVSGGSCSCKTPGGVVLDNFKLDSVGGFSGANVDVSKLDDSKQVLIDCETKDGKRFSTLCNLTDTANGQTIDCGKVNADTTLYTSQTISECGSGASLDSLSACASASGFKPLALFQTFSGMSGTAGVDDTSAVHEAFKAMIRAAYAGEVAPSPADIVKMIQGDTSLINKYKALDSAISSLDTSSLADGMKDFPGACKDYYGDTTLYNNYLKGGVSGFSSGGAKFFAALKPADHSKIKSEPTLYHTVMGEYVSAWATGNANAFQNFAKPDFARTVAGLGQFIDPTDFSTSGKAAAYRNLLEGGTWGTSKDPAQLAEAFANACKSGNTAAEFGSWNTNGAAFAGKYINNPGAFLGASGQTTIDNQFVNFIQDPTTFVGAAQGCSPGPGGTSCPSGMECSGGGFCVSTCTSNCGFMSPCSNNGQCASGFCSSAGYCHTAEVQGATCGNGLLDSLKINGTACSTNSTCQSCNCSSGQCISNIPSGSATVAGAYKKNAGGTCIFFLNIAGTSGNTNASFSPNDINNPQSNTIHGGCPVTGTATPFSIALCNVATPGGVAATIRCDGSGGSDTLSLAGVTLTGTCALGGGLSGTCEIDHSRL